MGPLQGIRVIDLSRLAPGPYASFLLSDLGADVIVVLGGRAGIPMVALRRGKREIVLDLKSEPGQAALHELVKTADVLLESFRPDVAARLGASYEELSAINPRLVYCSVTGYGQDGPLSQAAGHDINYVALSGLLGVLEQQGHTPHPPLNLLADFAGGGLLAALGIASALIERERSGQGQAIDVSMVDGVISLMAMNNLDFGTSILPRHQGGLMNGAAPFYRCYECKDGRFVSVGAMEDRFFDFLWKTLKMDGPTPKHMNPPAWPEITKRFEKTFLSRTRDEWAGIFEDVDACVMPVLDPEEARNHPHNKARGAHVENGNSAPVPRFSRTRAQAGEDPGGEETEEVLREAGLDDTLIEQVLTSGSGAASDGLAIWPPY